MTRIEEDEYFSRFAVSEEDQGNEARQDDEIPPGTDSRTIWSRFDGATADETIIRSGFYAGAWGYRLATKAVAPCEKCEVVCAADRDPAEEGPWAVVMYKELEFLSVGPVSTEEIAEKGLADAVAGDEIEGWVMTQERWNEICRAHPDNNIREGLLSDLIDGES